MYGMKYSIDLHDKSLSEGEKHIIELQGILGSFNLTDYLIPANFESL